RSRQLCQQNALNRLDIANDVGPNEALLVGIVLIERAYGHTSSLGHQGGRESVVPHVLQNLKGRYVDRLDRSFCSLLTGYFARRKARTFRCLEGEWAGKLA